MLLIREKFPKGFSDSDLTAIKTSDGNYMDVLEVASKDSLYIFRVSHDLMSMIEDFNESLDFSDELEPSAENEDT